MGTDMSQNGCYLYIWAYVFLMRKKVLESCVDISHYLHVLVAPQRWATNCWEVISVAGHLPQLAAQCLHHKVTFHWLLCSKKNTYGCLERMDLG